jgi:hypothetical protein
MSRGTTEAICPYCRALVWLRRSGLVSFHRVNGVWCRGSGMRASVLR